MVGESEEEEDEDQEYNEDEGEDSKVYSKLRDDFDNPIKVDLKKPRGSYYKGLDSFFPASMLFFILYGPYGVERYGFPVVSVLTTDTKTLEGDARSSKDMNTKSMRQSQKEESTYARWVSMMDEYKKKGYFTYFVDGFNEFFIVLLYVRIHLINAN